MPKIEPFEKYTRKYEIWFEDNLFSYKSEIQAIKAQIPDNLDGVEIGIGSGRFATPLDIQFGIDPSKQMLKLAKKRGIKVIEGIAENLPFVEAQFDFAMMVTTICFLDNIGTAFKEVFRILKSTGLFIIGFIDKESQLGKLYQRTKNESVFYKIATFYSVKKVVLQLKRAGFKTFYFTQTIFHDLAEVRHIEPIMEGYGKGSFVVISAVK